MNPATKNDVAFWATLTMSSVWSASHNPYAWVISVVYIVMALALLMIRKAEIKAEVQR